MKAISFSRLLMMAGALPFIGLLLASFFDWQLLAWPAERVFLAYGAIIVSFLGGIHWGYAILLIKSAPHEAASNSLARTFLALSNIVALMAWASLLFHSLGIALSVQLLALLLALFSDSYAFRLKMIPEWFWNLRRIITVIVASSQILLIAKLIF